MLSAKIGSMKAALGLHFCFYNFCRKHSSLKGRTPAMEAGIADRVWTLAEIIQS
jgi:hypothetical protein